MANTLAVTDKIAAETIAEFKNLVRVAPRLNRDYEAQFGTDGGMNFGDTVRLRDPVLFTVSDGLDVTGDVQAVTENTRNFSVNQIKNVVYKLNAKELALDVSKDRLVERYARPAATILANHLDYSCLLFMQQSCSNFVGVPGAVPTTFLTYGQAKQRIEDASAPRDERDFCVITPKMETNFVNLAVAYQNPPEAISSQYKKGTLKRVWGADFFMSQNCRTHTVGALGTTPITNGSNQTGSSLVVDGATVSITGYFKKGDKITCAGVNRVNILTKQDTGELMIFTVTADTDSDGSGNVTIPISPAIVASGPYQNVTNAAGDGKAILTFGHASTYAGLSTPQGMYVHPDAFTLAIVPLAAPPQGAGVAWKSMVDEDTGIAISYGMQSDLLTMETYFRMTLMFGIAATHPDWACVICS